MLGTVGISVSGKAHCSVVQLSCEKHVWHFGEASNITFLVKPQI